MIPNSVVWWSNKGGIGKSALTANHAVLCAKAGWRVLVVDLDPQDDQRRFLAAEGDPEDNGSNVIEALRGTGVLQPTRKVRDGLDLIRVSEPQALELNEVTVDLWRAGRLDAFEAMLDPICDDYDLLLFDLPPSFLQLHALVYQVVHFNVLVTMPRELEVDHIAAAIRLLERGWFHNPELEVLACIYNQHPTQASAIKSEGDRALDEILGGYIDVLERPIRASYAGFNEMMKHGYTVVEYRDAVARRTFDRLSESLAGANESQLPPRIASGTKAIADEVTTTIREINQRYTDRLAAWMDKQGIAR